MKRPTNLVPYLRQRRGIWYFDRMLRGRRIQLSLHTRDLAEAMRKRDAILDLPEQLSDDTLLGAVDAFLQYRLGDGSYARASLLSRRSTLNGFARDLGEGALVRSIGAADVQRWYEGLLARGCQLSTARNYLNDVRAFFRWCVDHGAANGNPVLGVKRRRGIASASKPFCSEAQRDQLLQAAPPGDMATILHLGFLAGFRANEITEARPAWFDLSAKLIHLGATPTFTPKSRKARTVPMCQRLVDYLSQCDLSGTFLVRSNCGAGNAESTNLYRYAFRARFRRFVAAQGLPWVTPHIMRHTFASLLVSAGVSVFKVAKWLGIGVLIAERHYAKLIPNDAEIELLFRRHSQQ